MQNKDKNNNITERIGIVVIIILILLLSFRRKLFFKNEDNITIEPDKNLLELTASETTDGLNGNSTQIISLTQQITNLTEYITYLTNQINESNGDNSVLEAEVAALQSQLNICQGSCFDIELSIIKQPSGVNTPNGCIGLKVKNGNGPFTYEWKKNGVFVTNSKSYGFNYGYGLWTCTVKDSNNVSITKEIQLDALSDTAFTISSYNLIPPSSDLALDGTFGFNLVGGLAPYKFFSSSGITANPQTGIGGFQSTFLISDSVGNSTFLFSGIIPNGSTLLRYATFYDNYNTGIVFHNTQLQTVINLSGRNKNGETYTYLWSNGATTDHLINPTAGTYSVTITGSLGSTQTITGIVATERKTVLVNISTSNSSGGANNGSIILNSITGRVGTNFTYHLYNNTTEEFYINPTALKAGNYTLTAFTDHGETVSRTGITIL